jgi:hypothetical protein
MVSSEEQQYEPCESVRISGVTAAGLLTPSKFNPDFSNATRDLIIENTESAITVPR